MKALFINDGFLTKENIDSIDDKNILSILKNIEIEYAADKNIKKMDTMSGYLHKIEKEGPEGWIVADKETLEKIETTDILFVHTSGVTKEMIETGKNLKAIFCFRSGVEGINLKAATENGISVSNCPSRLADHVSDMAIALMLSECRGIVRSNLKNTQGVWQQNDIYQDKTNGPYQILQLV